MLTLKQLLLFRSIYRKSEIKENCFKTFQWKIVEFSPRLNDNEHKFCATKQIKIWTKSNSENENTTTTAITTTTTTTSSHCSSFFEGD